MKRIILFLLTNFAVLLVLSIVLKLLGVNPQTAASSLIMAAIIGFSGSLISLFLSKSMAKRSVNAQVITQASNVTEAWLLQTVADQAAQWRLKTPELAIYHAPEPNAFATGASRNNALIAVSTGLLNHMTRDEVEAVLAHEMAHVGNGDMVTMTLIQGVVNTFVIFLSRTIASVVTARDDNGQDRNNGVYFLVMMVLEVVFGILASLIVMWFSRQREYRADADAAKLTGADKMIAALQRLQGQNTPLPQSMSAMGISGSSLKSLFSTHPSLDSRIQRLQQNANKNN